MTRTLAIAIALLCCSVAIGCGGSSGGGTTTTAMSTVSWNLTGLEPLQNGFEYEGWIIVDGQPVSTGRFNVDMAGMPSSTSTMVPADEASRATAFVLTIEPAMDADPGPAATKILGGDFNGGQAPLTVGHMAALGDDFTGATGSFIIATPSTAVNTDETQGIWWVNPGNGQASLMLPTLPAGWVYEGWVVSGGGPVSTGVFTDPATADSDLAGPTGGTDSNGPPFPGQDFITPPMDLIGLTAVISIEPSPDDSPAPFTLKPLVASPITNMLAPTLQPMSNNAAATNPTGTATIN